MNTVWEANLFFYMWIVSLMFQTVNLLWEIVIQNAGCVFGYFCGEQTNSLRL